VVSSIALPQERVVVAGQDGVAAPKRTKTVQPVYPQEALAQGIRGIVILEVLIDPQGKVVSAEIIRSIPALDEAALEAVRNWEYEVTKVDGKPVSVKLTVPITFAMKLPEVTRAPGIPELRQGIPVPFPAGQTEAASVTAEVTLAPDGQVAEAEVIKGSAPWTTALLSALRTWRFASEGENVVLSFRVEADFTPGKGDRPRVEVRLTGLRRSEAAALEPPASSTPPPPGSVPEPPPPPATPEPATEATPPVTPTPGPPATPPPAVPATMPPAPTPTAGTPPAPPPPATTPPIEPAEPAAPVPAAGEGPSATPAPAPAPAPATAAPPASPPGTPSPPRPDAATSTETKPAPAGPPVEVITAPRPPAADRPALPAQPGVSAIKDVALALGVPDLVRGRRPVPPPLARMAGTTGAVEVKFGVDAAGVTSVTESTGPDVLRTAATYTVQSWLFRRVTAERLHLVAVFDFSGETARASVKPE
jgi:TonB family protein